MDGALCNDQSKKYQSVEANNWTTDFSRMLANLYQTLATRIYNVFFNKIHYKFFKIFQHNTGNVCMYILNASYETFKNFISIREDCIFIAHHKILNICRNDKIFM